MSTPKPQLGEQLFRLRSLTPVPIIVLCLALLWFRRAHPLSMPLEVARATFIGGLVFAMLGQALRFYTLGWVSDGTSGQDNFLRATTLNTKGPYAYVRNPLYVGNLGIVVGLVLIAREPFVAALALAFFFGEYFFIIRAEEAFLRGQFGAAFDAYCAQVSRWIPRLTPTSAEAMRPGPFDWRRALKKEVNPFSAWALGVVGLLAWHWFCADALGPTETQVLLGVAGAVVLLLLTIKAWKKGWLFS